MLIKNGAGAPHLSRVAITRSEPSIAHSRRRERPRSSPGGEFTRLKNNRCNPSCKQKSTGRMVFRHEVDAKRPSRML